MLLVSVSGGCMYNVEQTKKIESSTRVRFSADTKDNEPTFTPYKNAMNRTSFSRMKKEVLEYLVSEQFEKIVSCLEPCAQQEMREFYQGHGRILFSWSIIDARHVKPLEFLLQYVPEDVVQSILSDHQFSILRAFLGAQKSREMIGQSTEDSKALALAKIKAILKRNNPEVNHFIGAHMDGNLKENLQSIARTAINRP